MNPDCRILAIMGSGETSPTMVTVHKALVGRLGSLPSFPSIYLQISKELNSEDPSIIIGPGATVQGELRFERKVRLFVSDRATIGTVTGATAVSFTGDNPPH